MEAQRARVQADAMKCLLAELAWSMKTLISPSIRFFHLTEGQLISFAANPIKFNGKNWQVVPLTQGQATIFWPGPGDSSCTIVWVEKACSGRAREYLEIATESAKDKGAPSAGELMEIAQKRNYREVFLNQKLIPGNFVLVTVCDLLYRESVCRCTIDQF